MTHIQYLRMCIQFFLGLLTVTSAVAVASVPVSPDSHNPQLALVQSVLDSVIVSVRHMKVEHIEYWQNVINSARLLNHARPPEIDGAILNLLPPSWGPQSPPYGASTSLFLPASGMMEGLSGYDRLAAFFNRFGLLQMEDLEKVAELLKSALVHLPTSNLQRRLGALLDEKPWPLFGTIPVYFQEVGSMVAEVFSMIGADTSVEEVEKQIVRAEGHLDAVAANFRSVTVRGVVHKQFDHDIQLFTDAAETFLDQPPSCPHLSRPNLR